MLSFSINKDELRYKAIKKVGVAYSSSKDLSSLGSYYIAIAGGKEYKDYGSYNYSYNKYTEYDKNRRDAIEKGIITEDELEQGYSGISDVVVLDDYSVMLRDIDKVDVALKFYDLSDFCASELDVDLVFVLKCIVKDEISELRLTRAIEVLSGVVKSAGAGELLEEILSDSELLNMCIDEEAYGSFYKNNRIGVDLYGRIKESSYSA